MINYVIIAVLVLILGGAAFYIYKAKKSGKKCIGCPASSCCSGKCDSCNETILHEDSDKK